MTVRDGSATAALVISENATAVERVRATATVAILTW
jgi:hypothetical protein